MIGEYALEPEMIAAWCTDHYKCQLFKNQFGPAQGRLPSRYPKRWVKKVWESFAGGSDMDRARLTELLVRLQETMIKRKDFVWEENATWLDNAVQEHNRHPFRAVLARNNQANRPEILCEGNLDALPCPGWDSPHGITVNRKAPEMAAAVQPMLVCCRWVKFVDPYFVQCKTGHKKSLLAYLEMLAAERAVGQPETIELHTGGAGATTEYLKEFYEKIIPAGLQVTLYRWQEKPGGQRLHNRYILTDLGGVSFHHGLDTGADGEIDDLTRLDLDQYLFRCSQYNPAAPAYDQAADPLVITGTLGG
jgi:hypothetical protein